jgi:hypothetical protein
MAATTRSDFSEDGFTAIVSPKTTKALVQHLRRGEAITLDGG